MERVTRSGNLRSVGMSENSRSKSCLLRTVWRKECGGKTEVAARKWTELLLPQSFIRSKHPSMSVSHILIYCRNPRLKNPSVYTQLDSVVDHWKKKNIYFAACASLCFLCNVLWTGSTKETLSQKWFSVYTSVNNEKKNTEQNSRVLTGASEELVSTVVSLSD